MQVETKSASLDTLAVTIQALHVSGKQMTLAVFRQLPTDEEREDSELWGVVRYAIKDQGDVWLVFSHDGTLRRRALELGRPRADHRDLDDLKYELEIQENNWRFHSRQPASQPVPDRAGNRAADDVRAREDGAGRLQREIAGCRRVVRPREQAGQADPAVHRRLT